MNAKKKACQKSRRFGGRATARGVGYEVAVASLIGAKMLAGNRSVVWDDISGADIEAITMQGPEAVDDIVVSIRRNASVFISAKYRSKSIPLTSKSRAFADTVDAFVRQFLKFPADSRAANRLMWVVPSSAGTAANRYLRSVLESHRDYDSAMMSEFLRSRQTVEIKAMDALIAETKRAWKNQIRKFPSADELCEFLRMIHIEVYDFEAGQPLERQAESDIRAHIVTDPKLAKRAWRRLENFFDRADQRGLRVTAASLRRALVADGIKLQSPPNFTDDLRLLNELTDHNLRRLKNHTLLRFGKQPADEIHIARTEEFTALLTAAKTGHLLVTGDPGCGKSGLIHELAEGLRKDGLPVVLLLAEEVFGRDWKSSANLPGLMHALDEVLANWPNGSCGFLLTDALDAVRDVQTQKLLRRLLEDVKHGQSGWHVIASVREFDLKHSRELREAFPGDGVVGFSSCEFRDVLHFHVPILAESKLDELCALRSEIRPFVECARKNPKSGGIHRSPFFLRLAGELLRDGVTPIRLADWNSPAVLLRKFWDARVLDGAGTGNRKVALQTICRQMTELRSMALSTQELALSASEHDAIIELRSRGILQSPALPHGTRVGDEDVRFIHHLLHDYAIARSLIPAIPERFAEFAIREPLLPVFYRQSFIFALEELWDAADDRRGFWDATLNLEGVAQLHGVTRILAPILAARRVETLTDLQPLLTLLDAEDNAGSRAQKALQHLASGLQDADSGAICAGASAWCAFAEKLAAMPPRIPGLESPLVHIVARLIAASAAVEKREQLALNAASRGLLAHHVSKEIAQGWRYAASTGIEGVCKTFDAAPAESECVLLSLLTPQRLAQFPHWDLFDFAHQIEHLSPAGDPIVLRLFEAAFASEPEYGEWENFGGAILPLRMQRSDNWNSVQYSLAEYYQARSGENAALMTEIECITWNGVVRRRQDRRDREETVLATISFRGVSCDLVQDFGHICDREFEHEENRILSHFETLLRGWAADDDAAKLSASLDSFARRNRTSMLWTVFMEAGTEHPATLGILLEEVLSESLFLTHPDYCYGGTALLGALHKMGDAARRKRLERLILDLPKTARFVRDEPREPMPSWLEHAQDRLLGALRESNIVLSSVRDLRKARSKANKLPANHRPEGPCVFSHTYSDEELIERKGINLKDPANAELFRLREALKPFIERDGNKINVEQVVRRWRVIGECERALRHHRRRAPQMAEELWGHLTTVMRNIMRRAKWPAGSQRWKTIGRILLKAACDPNPAASKDENDSHCSSWGWPAPRVDAAEGLPLLVYSVRKADKAIATALRKLCRDQSCPVRFNLAERLAILEPSAPILMWELIDIFVANEKVFSVLEALLHSLDRLWAKSSVEVMRRLRVISSTVMEYAPANHHIHKMLAHSHLFRFLRTGDAECEAFIERLIQECDSERASHALAAQLHTCRAGGWLTAGDGVISDAHADDARTRTWNFFSRLLAAAQSRLQHHRARWRQLHEAGKLDAETQKTVEAFIERSALLVDGIGMQLFFASGAHDAKQNKGEERLSGAQIKQFWKEAAPLFDALAAEPHPHTAYHLVQTLYHLLSCAPRDVFLVATKAICTSASAGFQNESMAVGEVVKLVQRALADHRDIFKTTDHHETDCLAALLKVLDLFVEAGWPEARQLTHRLEEIYR